MSKAVASRGAKTQKSTGKPSTPPSATSPQVAATAVMWEQEELDEEAREIAEFEKGGK